MGLAPPFVTGFAGETGGCEDPGAVTKMFGPPWTSWFSNRSIGNEAGTEFGDAVTDQRRRYAIVQPKQRVQRNEEISVCSKSLKGNGKRKKENR